MVKHNLLIVYRNLLRNKSTFFINLTGLSMGLVCTFLIYLWVNDELKMDKFSKNDERLYQVMERIETEGKTIVAPYTSGPLAETLVKEIPDVETAVACVVRKEVKTVSVGNNFLKAIVQFAGKDYFNVFSYNLLHGNKDNVLRDKNSIVISEELAMKLFHSTDNIVGKDIEFEHEKLFQVTGIFKAPANASVQFDFVLPMEAYQDFNPNVLNWNYNSVKTYIVLRPQSDVVAFNKKIASLLLNKRDKNEAVTLITQRFSEGYLYGNYENGVQSGGRIEYVKLFSVIAFFILIIACINFMNLSTAKAVRRLKEMGVKKTLGASRLSFIFQHLGESVLMSFTSSLVAIVITAFLLPMFNQISDKNLTLDFNLRFIGPVLLISLVTGLISGSYPALYLSGFRPVSILKRDHLTSGKEILTRKGLVIAQFTISIILIAGVIVISQQIKYLQTKNLGYNKDNIIYFQIEGNVEKNLETFLTELRNIPGVVSASSIGQNITESGVNTFSIDTWDGKTTSGKNISSFEMRPVNYGMIEMLGIEMEKGRSFSKDFNREDSKIIFNEAAIEAMAGLKDPIGKTIEIQGTKLEIIGVAKNFHFASLHETIKPLFFVLQPSWTHYVMTRIEGGNESETLHQIQKFYQQFNRGFPFDYHFMDETYEKLYAAEYRVSALSRYFSGIAILISCLGLFGLATFTAERRTKEMGIRKVLGSGKTEIAQLLSGEFTKLIIVAIVVAIPVSYLIANKWLENFAYKTNLSWWVFVLAGLLSLGIALLTVSWQSWKAATRNPVEALRYE